ncbi:hypothetical protein STH12_02843 [Shewanella khirikhana]|uniref:Uncharacterized protein n=1 Tax=Shewanella khirikhana TaxID=1965282 RepID=A0ABM7DQE8_9GAMM|nr:hypothetical protein STH12_02843 [Shewanella khirikhana]
MMIYNLVFIVRGFALWGVIFGVFGCLFTDIFLS